MRPPGSPRTGVPGRLHREAAGERPPRARPQRRGSPGPIPNPAVKPAFAESTAARGCGRAGRRARGGRFSIARGAASLPRPRARRAERGPQGDVALAGLFCVLGRRPPHPASPDDSPFRLPLLAAAMRRARRRAAQGSPQPFLPRGWQIDLTVPAALRRHRTCRGNSPAGLFCLRMLQDAAILAVCAP